MTVLLIECSKRSREGKYHCIATAKPPHKIVLLKVHILVINTNTEDSHFCQLNHAR